MKNITKFVILVAFLIAGKLSFAQTVVVPNSLESTNAGGTFTGPLANTARCYQLLINESQLMDMIGQNVEGISFRSGGALSTTWPVNLTTYDNYDIYLSESVAPASKSLIFANNVVGTQTQVRSGELIIEPDSYDVGSAVSFGPTITFDTPYLYTGGHLLLEIRHTGSNGTSRGVNALAASGGAPYGVAVGANWSSGYTPPTGNTSQGNAAVVRFSYSSATPVVSVEVDTQGGVPAEITTDNGTLQLEATVNPSNAVQTVTWSVESGTGLATVNANGLVTAIDNGTVVVRATSTSNTAIFDEITITITNQIPPVSSIVVTTQGGVPAEISTDDGMLQLEATVNPSDAVQTVTWSIQLGSDFASVDADGLVTAIDNGTVVVRATSTENTAIFGEITITITNQVLPVASVVVATQGGVSAEITTDEGTLQLVATVNPSNSEQTVTWLIESGSDFASIDNNGLVTAIDNGTVVVRAASTEDVSIFGEITITITNQVLPVVSVEVETQGGVPAEITTDNGTLQLIAIVNPSNSEQTVTWSIESGSDFASVDNNGLVTAIDNGTVVIRAVSTEDTSIFGEITITITNQVPDVDTIEVTTLGNVEALITTIGGTLQLVATVNPSDAAQTVIWSVATFDDAVSVDVNGLVTALSNGQALVRATSTEDETIFGEILVIVDTTASTDNVLMNSVKIYPNPTNGIVHISNSQEISSIEIFTIAGQRIFTSTNTEQIDLTDVNTGTYIAKIVTEKGVIIQKIVKQ